MSKKWIIVTLFFLFLLLGEPTAVQAQTASNIFQLVNQFRQNNGLVPFQYSSALAAAAQNQANFMAANNIFDSHIGSGGSTPQSRAAAAGYVGRISENIVGGTGMTAAGGLNWWINSPIHYRTLVTSRYQEAGTGFASNGNVNYYVLVVGQPSNAPPPPAADDSPAPLFITPIILAQPGEDGAIVHTVLEGQALWSLAAYYTVPLSDLLLFNNLSPDAIVQPGDQIVIQLAEGQVPPPTPTPPTVHTVLPGQSLWSIALQYNIKLGDILWLNSLPEDAILQPGELIRVRLAPDEAPPPTATPVLYHSVRRGQTLWEVALSYGLSLDELLALNNLEQDAILQPGDQLLIRAVEATATPIPSPMATAVAAAVLPEPTATVNTAVSSQVTSPPTPTVILPETAVSTTPTNDSPTILSLAAALLGSLLIVGFIVAIVLRRELI
jgi:LysM repeat protein